MDARNYLLAEGGIRCDIISRNAYTPEYIDAQIQILTNKNNTIIRNRQRAPFFNEADDARLQEEQEERQKWLGLRKRIGTPGPPPTDPTND